MQVPAIQKQKAKMSSGKIKRRVKVKDCSAIGIKLSILSNLLPISLSNKINIKHHQTPTLLNSLKITSSGILSSEDIASTDKSLKIKKPNQRIMPVLLHHPPRENNLHLPQVQPNAQMSHHLQPQAAKPEQ